jgi:hypothetical protein
MQILAYDGSNSFMTPDMWTPIERAATEQLASTLTVLGKRVPRAESVLSRGARRSKRWPSPVASTRTSS